MDKFQQAIYDLNVAFMELGGDPVVRVHVGRRNFDILRINAGIGEYEVQPYGNKQVKVLGVPFHD